MADTVATEPERTMTDMERVALLETIKGRQRMTWASGDFGIIGTANPNYVGTLEIGRAMERRFSRGLGYIEMTFIPPDEEAAAIVAEFDGTALFKEREVRLDPTLARRLTDLAAELRRDEQIGNVLVNRLSTRAQARLHRAARACAGQPEIERSER